MRVTKCWDASVSYITLFKVPRRYDEEEEKQLFREINAMKILKTHDYIANLLGWFNKHNFACTIMELTHTNLLKYASQVRDSCEFETSSSSSSSSVSTLPFKQYLRMFIQICDAMVTLYFISITFFMSIF